MKRVIKPVTSATGSSADMLDAFYQRLEEVEGSTNVDNIEAQTAITADRRDNYFGEVAAFNHGDKIAEAYLGKTISKRKNKADEPGSLKYEAEQLGIDMFDLLEALEGMCADGRAKEYDTPEDSYYEIISTKRHPVRSLFYDEANDPDAIWKTGKVEE